LDSEKLMFRLFVSGICCLFVAFIMEFVLFVVVGFAIFPKPIFKDLDPDPKQWFLGIPFVLIFVGLCCIFGGLAILIGPSIHRFLLDIYRRLRRQ